MIERIVIEGKPATKKNHNIMAKAGGRSFMLPSKQYAAFEKMAIPQCRAAWGNEPPIDYGVAISVKIYNDTWRIGDHCGYLQAIGDMLEKAGVVADDKWIAWTFDGHWLGGVDNDNPRIELTITRMRHPMENR